MKREKFHVTIIRLQTAVLTALLIFAGIFLIGFSKNVGTGIREGLAVCANVLIPSLFPFMIFSSFLLKTRAEKGISFLLKPVTRYAFGLNPKTGAVILLSLIGGYPVGAKLVSQMKANKEISEKTARRLMYFCVNAGPAFITVAVGSHMFGSFAIGLILLVSQLTGSILIAVISRFLFGSLNSETELHIRQYDPPSVSLVKAVSEAASAMLTICTFVVAFWGFSGILSSLGIPKLFSGILSKAGIDPAFSEALLAGLMEVTSGCTAAAKLSDLHSAVMLTAFLTSFGGFCVLFQIKAFLGGSVLRIKHFFLVRLFHGGLSMLVSRIFLFFVPDQITAAFASQPKPVLAAGSLPASVALILLCVALVFSVGGQHQEKISK